MSWLSRILVPVVLVMAACGGGDDAARPSDTTPAPPAPTTVAPTTAKPTTTAPTTTAPATEEDILERLAARLPAVAGYHYSEEAARVAAWELEGATTLYRSILLDGTSSDLPPEAAFASSWVGVVAVADAGEATPQAWAAFVDSHHNGPTVFGSVPVTSGDYLAMVRHQVGGFVAPARCLRGGRSTCRL